MPMNTLTGKAGLKLGPLVLETLLKHYFDRVVNDRETSSVTNLRQEELLYDEAFNIVKNFLDAATKHTIEEIQSFSNARTPAPPWVRVVKLLVPMSCCEEAATHLVKALGGEEVAKRVVGGTKWWQVRGLKGVQSEWIVAKKDWEEAKKRHKAYEKEHKKHSSNHGQNLRDSAAGPSVENQDNSSEPDCYDPEMDAMRCILWFHGGGYYFGSVDQERYGIQRYARKINGRVFSVNYRLAPQYPFPCAIQDALAAYLFLIRPPPDAAHRPVAPAHIVLGGDSAGGGITFALLQVLRDSGLPMPAGAVLVSPWCDMSHSFPSIHTNTATDVMPSYGLSFHKPSTLWPPPSEELTTRVHENLRSRIRSVVRLDHNGQISPRGTSFVDTDHAIPRTAQSTVSRQGHRPDLGPKANTLRDNSGKRVDVGSTSSLPALDSAEGQTITLETESGEVLTINQQIHFYVPNNLIPHPLVREVERYLHFSPALGYLGGLPPLFIVASDKEVLRDEIIYAAHKAAHPEKYPIKDETRQLYPALEGIEDRYGPTKVHLQVYDDAAHVLPVLFAFTTPAKYCYRAIATFCKYVTGVLPDARSSTYDSESASFPPDSPPPESNGFSSPGLVSNFDLMRTTSPVASSSLSRGRPQTAREQRADVSSSSLASKRRSLSVKVTRAASIIRRKTSHGKLVDGDGSPAEKARSPRRALYKKDDTTDVAGPRFLDRSTSERDLGARTAGDPAVYRDLPTPDSWEDNMIRERVSTQGVIRPLEPETDLPALQIPSEMIGVISELAARRYLDGLRYFDDKFAHTKKSIAKHRRRNLEQAKKDTLKHITQLQMYLNQGEYSGVGSSDSTNRDTKKGVKEGLMAASGSWTWAWALDGDEKPPPSSIVSRRDTEEARRLAKIADQSVLPEEKYMSGNNLWSLIVNFLTVTPDRATNKEANGNHEMREESAHDRSKSGSGWSRLRLHWNVGHKPATTEAK